MKQKTKILFKKVITVLTLAAVSLRLRSVTCLAADADVSDITDGIKTLKNLVMSCVAGVGVIFLAWGIVDFATAYSSHDTAQQSTAIKKVVGGIIMVCAKVLVSALGG